MATTTNYGWTTPDDTALVKDGAAAIRTLGSSVDTTTKALNPSTTLGDIEYRSSTANTNTRLGIGTSGQYLTVSGGVPAWGAISAGGMTLLSTTTLSGASTTISSIDQTYNNLQIIIFGMTNATANGIFFVKPNGSDSVLYWQEIKVDGTVSRGAPDNRLQDDALLRTDAGSHYVINVYDYANTTRGKPIYFSGMTVTSTSARALFGGGSIYTNSALTSIQFSNGGGNFSTGTVLIYGVK